MKIHNMKIVLGPWMQKIFFIVFFLLAPVIAEAAGCCQVNGSTGPISAIMTEDEITCDQKNTENSVAVFMPDKVADQEGINCVEKKVDTGSSLPKISNPLAAPNLSVSIPGFTSFGKTTCTNSECISPWLANYIDGLYRYGTGAIAILAIITMMIAGVIWLTAGGKEERVADAKQWIGGSLMGLLIALSSYMILRVINPALTTLSPIKIAYIGKIDLDQILPPEDLTPQYTSPSLPSTNLGTGLGKYKLPVLYQGRFSSQLKSMGSAGCGPTSLTMVLNYYGDNKSAVDVAKECQTAGYWGSNGWTQGMPGFKKMLEKSNLQTKSVGPGSSIEDALALLQYGPVIASMTSANGCKCVYPRGNAHYVVLTGYENGIVYANDPNEANHSRNWGGQIIDTAKLELTTIKKCCKINAGAITAYK